MSYSFGCLSTRSLYLHSSSSFLYPLNNDNYFPDVLYVGVFNSINFSNRIYMYVYSCPVLLRFVHCYQHYLPFTRHMLSPELQFIWHYWCTLPPILLFLSLLGIWIWLYCFNKVHKCFRPQFFIFNFCNSDLSTIIS